MIKILAFGDVHIGVHRYGHQDVVTGIHTRVQDTINSLKSACEIALTNKVDFVSILGDVFNMNTPSNIERQLFIDAISILFGKIPIYIIPGNHDRESLSHTLSSIKLLGTANGVHIIDTPQIIKIKDYNFVFVPWDKDGKMLKYIETVKDTSNSILFGHFIASSAVYSNNFRPEVGEDIVPLSLLDSSQFSLVAIGHIHKQQTLGKKGNIQYIGSLVKWDFSEALEQKGCSLIKIDNGVTLDFIPIPDRKFIQVDYKDVHSLNEKDIKDAVVKVVGECMVSEKSKVNINELKKMLHGKCFKIEDISIDFKKDAVINDNNQMFTPLFSAKQALINWARNNKLSQGFVDKGLKIIDDNDLMRSK